MAAAMSPASAAVRRHRPQAGFSLVEAVIALLLMGIAMLLTMALLAQEPGIERRLAAHHEALRLMEIVLEQWRAAGAVPADGEIDLSHMPRSVPPAAEELRMWARIEALPERSLYQVTLTTRYFVAEQPFEQSLESMIWKP